MSAPIVKRPPTNTSVKKESYEHLPWLYIEAGGIISACNTAAEELLGYSKDALVGMPLRALFCEKEQLNELVEAQSILTASQGEHVAITHLCRKDSSALCVRLFYRKGGESSAAEPSPFCCPMHLVALPEAIYSELKVVWGHLMEDCKRPCTHREALRSIGEQLRNPLTIISLSTSLLRNHSERMSASERSEEIRQLQASVEQCQKIVANTLAISDAVAPNRTPKGELRILEPKK